MQPTRNLTVGIDTYLTIAKEVFPDIPQDFINRINSQRTENEADRCWGIVDDFIKEGNLPWALYYLPRAADSDPDLIYGFLKLAAGMKRLGRNEEAEDYLKVAELFRSQLLKRGITY